ncbi:MAG: hypothetical protein AAFY56_16455 [Pseudomonadota bacterium]
MAQILVRGLSDKTKSQLSKLAKARGQSLEGFLRDQLNIIAHQQPAPKRSRFPYDLVELVEPGEEIETGFFSRSF